MDRKRRDFLTEHNLDGLLFVGDSVCDQDMYYLSRFLTADRFTLLASDRIYLLVPSMEQGRASKESFADIVVNTADFGISEKLKASGKPEEAYLEVLREFLLDLGVKRLGLPSRFPAGIFSYLSRNFEITLLDSPVSRWRAIKTEEEIGAIKAVQKACEQAMFLAVELISRSSPKGDYLYHDGDPLTSEKLRAVIEIALLERGCDAVDTIVAGGFTAADPHARGTGPLPANAPIVIDIFPRSRSSRYFADMTRTVLRGEASLEVKEMYDAVLDAQLAGLGAIRAGVSGSEVHSRVCQIFHDHGYPEREGKGFIHSTGHGVGLNVHERPSLGLVEDILEVNNVVTVEPGLYYPEIGGIRLEDLVVVTAHGIENLTNFERRLVV
ncbi:MAG: Xaa-Pro peptidase family protein [Methanotrichaceae archaeon]|nr:Xaa-Pro peptidase family protein [Methanotrichaceae archaeon]